MNNAIDTYKIFSDFYDLYVGHYDLDFEFYKSYCNKHDDIIEIGCGTGRILNYLLQSGCNLTGVDISQEMLDKASNKLKEYLVLNTLHLLNHDFTDGYLNERFDKALVTFYTFNYIIDKPIDFLRNVGLSLVDDGLLLMDVFYPNSLYNLSIDNQWIEKDYIINGRQIKLKDNRKMTGNIEHRHQIFCVENKEISIATDRRYYSPHELKKYLEMAGFTEIRFALQYEFSAFCPMIAEAQLKNNYLVKAKIKNDRN
jgi:SAM-dependent methyltransferase